MENTGDKEDRLDEDFMFYLSYSERYWKELRTEHDRTLCQEWLKKLTALQETRAGKRNRNVYLSRLALAMGDGELTGPFVKTPPEGPLPLATEVFGPHQPHIEVPREFTKIDETGNLNVSHMSKDGRTYVCTKSLGKEQGALTFIGISLAREEPRWVAGCSCIGDYFEKPEFLFSKTRPRCTSTIFHVEQTSGAGDRSESSRAFMNFMTASEWQKLSGTHGLDFQPDFRRTDLPYTGWSDATQTTSRSPRAQTHSSVFTASIEPSGAFEPSARSTPRPPPPADAVGSPEPPASPQRTESEPQVLDFGASSNDVEAAVAAAAAATAATPEPEQPITALDQSETEEGTQLRRGSFSAEAVEGPPPDLLTGPESHVPDTTPIQIPVTRVIPRIEIDEVFERSMRGEPIAEQPGERSVSDYYINLINKYNKTGKDVDWLKVPDLTKSREISFSTLENKLNATIARQQLIERLKQVRERQRKYKEVTENIHYRLLSESTELESTLFESFCNSVPAEFESGFEEMLEREYNTAMKDRVVAMIMDARKNIFREKYKTMQSSIRALENRHRYKIEKLQATKKVAEDNLKRLNVALQKITELKNDGIVNAGRQEQNELRTMSQQLRGLMKEAERIQLISHEYRKTIFHTLGVTQDDYNVQRMLDQDKKLLERCSIMQKHVLREFKH